MSDVQAYTNKWLARVEAAIIRRLQFLGEKCLTEARTNHTYTDQTGNLTSSMGYIVVANGSIVDTAGFNQGVKSISSGTGTKYGGDGSQIGKSLAESLALNYRTGYALIVVAGMSYAAYVESKGFNVLTSAEQLADKQLPVMLAALKRNIDKMAS